MTALAAELPRPRKAKLNIPRIKPVSWLGLESIAWGIVIAHIVKWAGNFTYFAFVQLDYSVGYKGANVFTIGFKDAWDRLPVHIQNGLPWIVVITVAVIWAAIGWISWRRVVGGKWAVIPMIIAGAGVGLIMAKWLGGWHVHWFPGQDEPAWWVTVRHYIRDVGIPLLATIAVQFLFTKPKYMPDDNPGPRRYVSSIGLALGAAMVPIAILGVVAWQLPWLTHHGLHVASHYPFATEANGYITAGQWIAIVMGVAGGIAARPFVKRVADDVQWFFAGRSAGRVESKSALSVLRGGNRVYGTPIHRARVHWMIDRAYAVTARNPWLVRFLLGGAFVLLAFAGAGAWLTIAGPAAIH